MHLNYDIKNNLCLMEIKINRLGDTADYSKRHSKRCLSTVVFNMH